MTERFSNQAVTALSAAIATTTATICNVTDASTFPASGNFRIKIDGEILLVTAVSTNTFTIVRGQEATVAATHASGANVIHLLTKGGLEARVANRFISDLYANKPAAGVKGRLFLPTDGLFMEYDDGAAWNRYGPYRRLKAPPQTGWNWINQGNATATFTGSILVLQDPDMDATATQLRLYIRPLAAGTTKITAAFAWNGVGTSSPIMGLCGYTVGGTDDGNIKAWGMRVTNSSSMPSLVAMDYTATSGGTDGSYSCHGRALYPSRFMWLKWELIGRYDTFSYSQDGVNWAVWQSNQATGTYNAPVQWGVFIDPTNNVMPVSLSLVHWEES